MATAPSSSIDGSPFASVPAASLIGIVFSSFTIFCSSQQLLFLHRPLLLCFNPFYSIIIFISWQLHYLFPFCFCGVESITSPSPFLFLILSIISSVDSSTLPLGFIIIPVSLDRLHCQLFFCSCCLVLDLLLLCSVVAAAWEASGEAFLPSPASSAQHFSSPAVLQ